MEFIIMIMCGIGVLVGANALALVAVNIVQYAYGDKCIEKKNMHLSVGYMLLLVIILCARYLR